MWLRIFIIIVIFFLPNVSQAHSFSLSPLSYSATITNFPLTEQFLSKMEHIHSQLATLPPDQDPEGTGNDNSIEGLTKAISGRPHLMALLTSQQLDAKTYVVGTMALQAALAAASAADDEDALFDEPHSVSKQNLAFAKAFIDRIRQLFES